MSERTGALVIGGNLNGLSIARSLGRQGVPVWVASPPNVKLANCSRYVRRSLPWPDGDDESPVEYLLEVAARNQLDRWVLMPTSDESAALLARFHDRLSHSYRVSTPTWGVLRWAYDKRLTYRLAAEQSVDFPATICPASSEHLQATEFEFPVVLKPATHSVTNRFIADKAWPAADRETLLARYREACQLIPPEEILVQERIPGGGESQFSFAALCYEGEAIVFLTARRTRQYPVDFGYSSSYVETLDVPEIEAPSRRLLAAIRYTGLVEVEYKLDNRTGRYKLLDINPRLWTWSTLGARAGVDFPYLLWRMLVSKGVRKRRGRPGAHWVRMSTDIPAAIHLMLRGNLTPRTYLRSLRGPLEFALMAGDDPLPGLMDLPLFVYKHLHNLFDGLLGGRSRKTKRQIDKSGVARAATPEAPSFLVSADASASSERKSQ